MIDANSRHVIENVYNQGTANLGTQRLYVFCDMQQLVYHQQRNRGVNIFTSLLERNKMHIRGKQ